MNTRWGQCVLLMLLAGCATDARTVISGEDTKWIERGKTTKQEVLAYLGRPDLTVVGSNEELDGESVVYQPHLSSESYRTGGLASPFEPRPRGSLPQVHRPPIESLQAPALLRSESGQFWIVYDRDDIVRDYGFGILPGITHAPSP
jgi:hypothetical protein